jgi:hypothetical protein
MKATRMWAAGAAAVVALAGAGAATAHAQAAPPHGELPALVEDARDLRDAGFGDESRAKAKVIVERYGADALPADLRSSTDRLDFWEAALATWGPRVRTGTEIVAAAIAAIVGVLLLISLGRWTYARTQPSLGVAPFTGPGADTLAASLASALREHLKRLDEDRTSTGPRLAETADASFSLPDSITTAFPPAGIVTALLGLLDRLAPRSLLKLTSTLRPVDPLKGAGVTLLLCMRRGEEQGQVTIWEHDFHLDELREQDAGDDLAARYQRLMLPAAIWLAYQPGMRVRETGWPAGTDDWRSYARFAVGEVAHRHGRIDVARRLYREALDLDPRNRAARLNLGWLLIRPPDRESDAEQEARLAEFGRHVGYVLDRVRSGDPLWLRAQYLRTIADLYLDDLPSAARRADALLAAIEHRPAGGVDRLADLRASMRGPVTVLRACIAVEQGTPVPEPVVAGEDWVLPTTHYNLACFYSRKARRARETGRPEDAAAAEQAVIEHLAEAIERLGPAYTGVARNDPALRPMHGVPAFDALVPPTDEERRAGRTTRPRSRSRSGPRAAQGRT